MNIFYFIACTKRMYRKRTVGFGGSFNQKIRNFEKSNFKKKIFFLVYGKMLLILFSYMKNL